MVIVPNARRYGDITLRGRLATAEGRAAVKAALETLSPMLLSDVLDESDLAPLRTSAKLGDLVAEARAPYAFARSEPPAGEWRASHGSREELAVPLVLAGRGFRPGAPAHRPGARRRRPVDRRPAQASARARMKLELYGLETVM